MYSQATVTVVIVHIWLMYMYNYARAVLVWSGGLKIETWEAQEDDLVFYILGRDPAQAAFLMVTVELGFLHVM